MINRPVFVIILMVNFWGWVLPCLASASFQEALPLPAGESPRGVSAGDIEGHGFSSFAVANFGSSTFIGLSTPASLLNSGHSNIQVYDPSPLGLRLSATLSPASGPRGLFLFDMENIGRKDLLVTSYDSNLLQVFRWDKGKFMKVDEEATLKMPVGLSAGFLRPGGGAFAVVADYGSNQVSVYPIIKGHLGKRVDVPVDLGPTQVAVGDLEGNGKCEIAVACLPADKIDLLSMGSSEEDPGSFAVTKIITLPEGSAPSDLRIGDLNGDGLADLAVICFSKNTLNLFYQQKDGSLLAQAPLSTSGLHPNGLTLADLNGDGKTEIVVANRDSNSMDIFQKTGAQYLLDETLKVTGDANSAFGPVEIAALDTTGTGKIDLVASHMSSNSLKIFKNESLGGPDGTPGSTPTVPAGEGTVFSDRTTFCAPNPSRDGKTKICFNLPDSSTVLIQIYDLTGRVVWNEGLGPAQTSKGSNSFAWNGVNQMGNNLASGLYLCRISADGQIVTKKIAIIR